MALKFPNARNIAEGKVENKGREKMNLDNTGTGAQSTINILNGKKTEQHAFYFWKIKNINFNESTTISDEQKTNLQELVSRYPDLMKPGYGLYYTDLINTTNAPIKKKMSNHISQRGHK